ncbi:TSUP family transporter [Oceanicoccus sp. KOV_DT_Chl]|uniref:TSUP family transporter n=1 Tax=Oceanicoccus sp. KOV_DT_Chl TaxID=1904639 RepID=UPI000C7D0E1C|nr:TSUP family transporter [Oceanicoccus sp. KOV_DT_Chl]
MLLATGFVGGFINAIAGGGGLIGLPVMLWLGIPPLNALATNKFQAVFGTLSSSANFFRQGFIEVKLLLPVMLCAMLASVAGTLLLLQLSNALLMQIIPFLLIALALFTWFSPRLNDEDHPPLLNYRHFVWVAGGIIGFYGGFFGPGIGAIALLTFSMLHGYNLRSAGANAKLVIVTANSTSVIIFLMADEVLLRIGLMMAVAQMIGAYFGSNLAIKKGAAVIKPLLVFTTMAIAVKLLLDW